MALHSGLSTCQHPGAPCRGGGVEGRFPCPLASSPFVRLHVSGLGAFPSSPGCRGDDRRPVVAWGEKLSTQSGAAARQHHAWQEHNWKLRKESCSEDVAGRKKLWEAPKIRWPSVESRGFLLAIHTCMVAETTVLVWTGYQPV